MEVTGVGDNAACGTLATGPGGFKEQHLCAVRHYKSIKWQIKCIT